MKKLLALTVCAVLTRQAGAVGSGAFTNQMTGSRALGMANAFTAVADDSSALYFNPAGLSQVGGEVSLGVAPNFPSGKYKDDFGTSSKMASQVPVVPNLYASFPLAGSPLTLAFGLYSDYGLGTHWPGDGPLRYLATDSTLSLVKLGPALAWKVSDTLSVGGGVVYAFSDASLENRLPLTVDGTQKLTADGAGLGVNAGILYTPVKEHRLGLSYRSETKITLEGDVKINDPNGDLGLGTPNYQTGVKSDINFPPSLTLGYAFAPGKWTLAVDGEWVRYSSIRSTQFEFSETNPANLAVLNNGNPISREWRDSWNLGLGVEYKLTDSTRLRAGYNYLPTVIPEKNWEPSTPEAIAQTYALGAGTLVGGVGVDLAYNYIRLNNRRVHNLQGQVFGAPGMADGTYKISNQAISLNLTWKFKGVS
jgi:long-chain fatty acid transport protein